jgi:hypothetical protein
VRGKCFVDIVRCSLFPLRKPTLTEVQRRHTRYARVSWSFLHAFHRRHAGSLRIGRKCKDTPSRGCRIRLLLFSAVARFFSFLALNPYLAIDIIAGREDEHSPRVLKLFSGLLVLSWSELFHHTNNQLLGRRKIHEKERIVRRDPSRPLRRCSAYRR